ncbi:hypothetical protein ACN09D_14625 [Serratia fonticola]|uniref:glycine-rich domain-containing protein n=1 Tax=Serratia fonticola TaxID=47917 RepID=UPI003AF3D44E
MAKNEFLPFGTGAGANVLSNDDYQALLARVTGFTSGVAKSEELNSAWRQASVMAAALGQFISDKGKDALDDGDLVTLKANLVAALDSQAVGRLLGIKVFTASGTYTPTPGTKKIRRKVWGGGGGGGGTQAVTTTQAAIGGGGSAGAYSESFDVVPSTMAVIVGLGGVSSSTTDGTNGGTSSAGSVTAPGGVGGAYGVANSTFPFGAAPRNSTIGSGGNVVNAPGNTASMGFTWSSSGGVRSMGGQSSVGASLYTATSSGYASGGSGSVAAGGSGAVAAQAGYNGAPGLVIIEEYA